MPRWTCFIYLLLICSCCWAAMAVKEPLPTDIHDSLTIFVTGNQLSTLKPCGCSEGQLGGFERTTAILNAVPVSRRLLINTGNLVAQDSEQDLIKFDIIIQALSMLKYDFVNLTPPDTEIARKVGVAADMPFNVITYVNIPEANIPARLEKKLKLGKKDLSITVATIDADANQPVPVENLFCAKAGEYALNILITNNCERNSLDYIADANMVDVVICSAPTDVPELVDIKRARPLVCTVGHLGQYVGRLEITPGKKEKLVISFEAIAVEETLPEDKSLVRLYKAYQKIVKDMDLLGRVPRFELPDGLQYLGSKSCALCHEYEYQKWSTNKHAAAFQTLKDLGSEFDPECVVCHVVGLEYNGGFISEQKTPQLKDVGCENCHGPGSEHMISLGKAKTRHPKSECANCHTSDHSPGYIVNKEAYLKKIVHWKEQKAGNNVSNK